ncbi:MAG TPA: proton-conducting transporter membrane subunit [bacterium]|nr:proton-conducting transporter membrane subunit [bacterium]
MSNLSLFISIPAGLAFFIPMVSRRIKWFPDIACSVTTFILFLLSLQTLNQQFIYEMGGWPTPMGIVFVLDGFSCMMLIIVNLIGFIVSLFSVDYIEKIYTSKLRYYSLLLLVITGINGVILAGDFFNMFVFLELALIASYALVGFGCGAKDLEASFKYMVINLLASYFILLAIALLYGKFATVNMAHTIALMQQYGKDNIVIFAFVLFLVGFGTKAAIVPFHAWVPDAYTSAPAPISALLAGGIIKGLGIYVLMRLTYNIFGMSPLISNLFICFGIISIVVGVLMALGQWNFKRLLAYHSISQMGYIMLGFGLGTPLGILGAVFHLLNHSLFKSLLFLNSGSVEYETGILNLKKLGCLSQKMPVTAASSLIASFSISGIPPFNGFWSKLIIIVAAVQAGRPFSALWAVIGSILTLASFAKIQRYVFFGSGEKFDENSTKNIKEIPSLMKMSVLILAILCTLGGFLAIGGVNGVFGPVVNSLSGGTGQYIEEVLGK